MSVEAIGRLQPLAPSEPLAPGGAPAGGGGFAGILNHMLENNQHATAAADQAIQALATGQAQDLHQVSLAVSQAELSFRLILELRNRLSDAFQEVSRMQV